MNINADPLQCFFRAVVIVTAYILSNAANASPIDPNDILVSFHDSANQGRGTIGEFTTTGTLVQKFLVPTGAGTPFGDPRAIAMDNAGNVQIYNFGSQCYLTMLTPTAGSGNAIFQSHTMAGWQSLYSGIAFDAVRHAIYAINTPPDSTGLPKGIIRFDSDNYSASLAYAIPATSRTAYIGLTLGQDGLLYASYPSGSTAGNQLDVIDPSTFTLLRTVSLPTPVIGSLTGNYTGWSVDAHGNIFAVVGQVAGFPIYEFNSQGANIKTSSPDFNSLQGLALSSDGRLLTLASGAVVMMTSDLSSYTSFKSTLLEAQAHAFPAWAVPEPTAIGLAIVGMIMLVHTSSRSIIEGRTKA